MTGRTGSASATGPGWTPPPPPGRRRRHRDAAATGTPTHDRARADYVRALRAHRNHPDGFWVAATDPAAADQALRASHPLCDVTSAAPLSDGASRLVTPFGLLTWPELDEILATGGPGEVIRRIRAAERSDPHAARWPRFKTHDDATIAYCTARHDGRYPDR